jgi:hypothetical protein
MARKPKYNQGFFKPTYPKKYVGSLPIIYRSGLELRYFRWCDRNPRILEWGSESVVVPYVSPKDGKVHRYYIDGVVKFRTQDGGSKTFLIEVKPHKQTMAPKPSKRKKRSTILHEQIQWAVNQAKWESATKFAKKNDCEFLILTEKNLK